jgi:hypothetical protein
MQEIKPNDSQMHFHFGNYSHTEVPNVHNLGRKDKKILNEAPKMSLERF